MYGVAMRIAAAQKLAERRMSSTPSISAAADVEAHEQPAHQHAQQRQRDDQVGDIVGDAEVRPIVSAPTNTPAMKIAAGTTASASRPAIIATTMPA